MSGKTNIKDLEMQELEAYIKEKGLPRFRAVQLFEWIYKDAADFGEMLNLPQNLRDALTLDFTLGRAQIAAKRSSKEDGTVKYLLCFEDGNAVECVLMRYSYGKTICISTQVGCRMACEFCASAQGGLIRNLSCGELLEEVMAVSRDMGERISNIVLMGTGEPFDNFEEVMKFLRMVNHEKGMNVGLRHITVSTSGIVPRIIEFADAGLQCTLAISLHAADDKTRSLLMPVNKKYNIAKVLEACRYYIQRTNKRVTFEYALIRAVNDGADEAEKLGKLLKGMLCHVNLIPVNQVEGKAFQKAAKDQVSRFKDKLADYGIEATVRRELGSDIDAACGQLRQKYIKEEQNML